MTAVSTESAAPVHPLARTLFKVAWMAVVVGLVLELILLSLAAALDKTESGQFFAGLVQKLSWSTLVCVGLGICTAAAKAVRPIMMGMMGFLSAPIAFAIARSLHKSVAEALSVAVAAGGGQPWMLALVKAIQYGCFGLAVGWLAKRPGVRYGHYAGVGFATGGVFGGLAVWLSMPVGGAAAADVVARAINELLFPVGCATVLYATQFVGRRQPSAVPQ